MLKLKQKQLKSSLAVKVLLLLVLVLGAGTGLTYVAHADEFDEKINALEQQNRNNLHRLNSLGDEAVSYEQAINRLQGQIDAIRAALNVNLAKQAKLQSQINQAQAELEKQKHYLSEDIRAMYIDGQLSTIEELATSKNLSEYVDKEAYRNSVKNKISEMIKEIAALQAKLEKQKQGLDILVKSQKQQNEQLAAAQSKHQNMLNYNEAQQSAYNRRVSRNNGQIAELRRQQLAANARFIGGGGGGTACGGGYPGRWCRAPMDSIVDTWGMYNRECVSYTAFRVAASGRYMPYWGGIGNANQWDDNARRAGIPTDGNPRPGDVAISNSGFYGHAMYVESVNGNGTINISQYNADWTGRYSTATISAYGLVFIHF
jgi:surface antigen/peptidoglycan hydrolase CwlO-like protein